MDRAPQKKAGRPLYSRRARGYRGDLVNLDKLRYAVLADTRFSTRSYMTLAHHVKQIGRILAPYAKGRKAR